MWQHSHPCEAFFLQTVNQESLSSLDSNSAVFSHNSELSSFLTSPCKIPLMINLIKHVTMLTLPLYLALIYLHHSKASHDPVLVCTLKDIPRPVYRSTLEFCSNIHHHSIYSHIYTTYLQVLILNAFGCSFLQISEERTDVVSSSWDLPVFNRPTLAFSEI